MLACLLVTCRHICLNIYFVSALDTCICARRAFYNFDYNRKGKITRGQWQTVFATVRIDVQEVTGIPQKKASQTATGSGAGLLQFAAKTRPLEPEGGQEIVV